MKVSLTKHGGLAAAMRRPPQVVDDEALPRSAVGELAQLVAAAQAAPQAKEGKPALGRDVMSYTITVNSGGQQIVLSQSDTTMSPAFAALLTWLERHAATT